MGEPDAREVAAWIVQVEGDLDHVNAELGPLVDRQTTLNERLGLLKRLMATLITADAAPVVSQARAGANSTPIRSYGRIRDRVQAHVVEILAEHEHPLHINEIHAEFIKRGFEVPGAGKANNITVHLADAANIRSTSRGYYAVNKLEHADSTVRYPVGDDSKGRRVHG